MLFRSGYVNPNNDYYLTYSGVPGPWPYTPTPYVGGSGPGFVIGGATRAGGGTYTSLSNLVEALRVR